MTNNTNSQDKETEDVVYGYSTDVSHLEEENKVLRDTIFRLREELDRMRRSPLLVCEVREIIDDNAMIRLPNGNLFFVNISSACEKLNPGDYVLAEQKHLSIIKKVSVAKQFNVERFVILKKPETAWKDIGGLDEQVKEIQEVIELPLKKPKLFEKVGIQPPKGILLHGPPGTGKTLLAKAVANSTNSTFIEIVGSELVQKFIGEGAKLVKEIFELAKEKAPSIIFIDELDALAAKRIEIGTSGEREVQRTFMQLLAEIDGFKHLGNVKVIGCTNRKDILDPAILRPGRLDRLIYTPLPNKSALKEIFNIHTKSMTLVKGVDVDKIINEMNDFSGAEVKAVCTEAGYFAIRASRTHVVLKDFLKAVEKVREKEEMEGQEYVDMFG
ncbi:proteasome-activating nucleotidase [Candidatus Woesearchaeota archaeon RBG_13_36_6]|nr:MAG: proteasome-activating nucleotidase [Candidatus Woesearchaeota archaeon RBG_13_36_6]